MIKKYDKKLTVLILALLLSFCGGFLEIYSLVCKGRFALMQTGNLIYTFTSLISSNFYEALVYLLTIVSFILGLFFSNFIEYKYSKKGKDVHVIELILIEVLILINIFIPTEFFQNDNILEANSLSIYNIISDILLSLIGAMLLESFKKINSHNFTSTMMTANLDRMVHSFFVSYIKKDKDKNEERIYGFEYIFIILSFGLGIISYFCYFYFLNKANYFKIDANYFESILANLLLILPLIFILIITIVRYFQIKSKKIKLED